MADLQRVNIEESRILIRSAIAGGVNLLLCGPPGVGKTAIVNEEGARAGMEVFTILGSTLDPTDVGGFPVIRENGEFVRVPMAALRQAALRGCIVFFDEISCTTDPVQHSLLRIFNDKVAGDTALHPDTRFLGAFNDADQARGFTLTAPLTGRNSVVEFYPSLDEVRSYFGKVLGADPGPFGRWCRQWGATAQAQGTPGISYTMPDLIQLDPPASAIDEGDQWAAPRNWERGFRHLAALPADCPDHLVFVALAAAVGAHAASGFLGLLKLADKLPSTDAIRQDPEGAPVPEDPSHQLGALGLLSDVATTEPWAAWIYANRLRREVGVAAAQYLLGVDTTISGKHSAAGRKAKVLLLGMINREAMRSDEEGAA